MTTRSGVDRCELGIALMEEQLLALVLYASTVGNWIDNDRTPPDLAAANSLLRRKHSRAEPQTHIEDGTPGVEGEILGLGPSWAAFHQDPQRLSVVLRVASTNAILAVAEFFEAHDLSELRTPEVQFLMRIRDAASNGNTFRIAAGERIPVASFNGLVINEDLNGSLLFDDGAAPGFMEFGDTAALLRYLMDHLRGAQTLISSGDAG
jgi:hypothetical protein